MNQVAIFAQSLGIAYAAGINLYATAGIVGLADRMNWIGPLPGSLGALSNTWIIALALGLFAFEFLATLIPGIASAWDTFHSVIRPPAAAALAAATAWHGSALFVVAAALLGGSLGAATHTTKLGLRYAMDTSPEPVTNGAANTVELGYVTAFALLLWQHPYIALLIGIVVLIGLMLTVRLIWRALRRVFSGHWEPARGYLQEARGSVAKPPPAVLPDDD